MYLKTVLQENQTWQIRLSNSRCVMTGQYYILFKTQDLTEWPCGMWNGRTARLKYVSRLNAWRLGFGLGNGNFKFLLLRSPARCSLPLISPPLLQDVTVPREPEREWRHFVYCHNGIGVEIWPIQYVDGKSHTNTLKNGWSMKVAEKVILFHRVFW